MKKDTPHGDAWHSYQRLPSLEHVYLEDSYVLGIDDSGGTVTFELEAVLTEEHASYHPPRENEQYCYERATLRFLDVVMRSWARHDMRPVTDADGEIDYGNIDSFRWRPGVYRLSGEWGEVEIQSEAPTFALIG